MRNNEFWVMIKKDDSLSNILPYSDYPGRTLPSICIVELTPDELVYLWPKDPKFNSLCLVCKNLKMHSVQICNTEVPSGYPCRFEAVPEASLSQDFDDFLVDGEYIAACGYYHSFADFKRQNEYSDEHFFCYPLGSFVSIRFARRVFAETAQYIADGL